MLPGRYSWKLTLLVILVGTLCSCSRGTRVESIVTSRVERKDYLDVVTVNGTLEAIRTHSFGVPGVWEDLTVQYLIPEGTLVKTGDTLCILKGTEIEAQYLQAINELEAAEAEYNKSVADLNLQYLILEAQVQNIEASTEISRLDSAQLEFTSPLSREIIRLELEKSEVERDITLKKLAFLKQINVSELQKMKLRIDQNKNRVDQAEMRLNRLTISSTTEGCVVYEKSWTSGVKFREGDVVWGNMPILNIPDLSAMQVKLEVSEADYKRLAIDQTMKISLDAFPEIALTGKIKSKAPVGKPIKENSDVKLFEVIASLDSASFSIQPGLGVTCEVLVNSIHDTIVVPVVSLFDEDSARVVYMLENSRFTRREVSVSEYNNKEAVITAGLSGKEILALMKPPESLVN
jgi:multidrug efflux pump subunit AcrA (membrane-fusion protein)